MKLKSNLHSLLRKLLSRFIKLILRTRFASGIVFVHQSFTPSKIEQQNMSVVELINIFDGQNIWKTLAPQDWPLLIPQLFAKNLIIVGGHTGTFTGKAIKLIPNLQEIHVYEPIEDFSKFAPTSSKIRSFSEAIFSHDGELKIEVAGDHTYVSEAHRENYVKQRVEERIVPCITFESAAERFKDMDISLMMNCEGSEYAILESVLEQSILPKSIIFQTHKTGDQPYLPLFSLRCALARKYDPVVCVDWAWDIWVRKN